MPNDTAPYTAETVRTKLLTDDAWLVRGLLAVFALQTEDERVEGNTTHQNGVGFNGVDAPFCTSLVEQFRSRGSLSPKQIAALRKIMPKYSGQLASLANRKAAGAAPQAAAAPTDDQRDRAAEQAHEARLQAEYGEVTA
jgi:hypothetical protein